LFFFASGCPWLRSWLCSCSCEADVEAEAEEALCAIRMARLGCG
jgi:hypothetical protein